MKSFLKSFLYAFRGLGFAWAGRNFRIQCGAAVVVIALGLWLEISGTRWLALVLIVSMILSMEALNTAIEETVNLLSPAFHPLAGKVKDLAAGAVLILSIASVAIGVIVFYPYLIARFVHPN